MREQTPGVLCGLIVLFGFREFWLLFLLGAFYVSSRDHAFCGLFSVSSLSVMCGQLGWRLGVLRCRAWSARTSWCGEPKPQHLNDTRHPWGDVFIFIWMSQDNWGVLCQSHKQEQVKTQAMTL